MATILCSSMHRKYLCKLSSINCLPPVHQGLVLSKRLIVWVLLPGISLYFVHVTWTRSWTLMRGFATGLGPVCSHSGSHWQWLLIRIVWPSGIQPDVVFLCSQLSQWRWSEAHQYAGKKLLSERRIAVNHHTLISTLHSPPSMIRVL
jgi:hypothetical protein